MLQDITLKPDSVTSEDVNDISKLILQENHKAMQNMQKEVEKIITDKNEEATHLKDHIEKLLTQIKKLKKDKKSLENKLQQLVEKEASKPSNVEIQVEGKGTNTDLVNIITLEEDKPVEVRTYSEIVVQTT